MFVVVVGDGANGKSVLLETLKHLVGQKNCSSVALESFDGRFDLAMTIGKLVNIVSEIGDVAKLPEGKLKSFVAGDVMTFDRKHREPLQVNPTARLVFGALEADCIEIGGSSTTGAPWGTIRGGMADGLVVVTKSGAFGTSDELARILALLGGKEPRKE